MISIENLIIFVLMVIAFILGLVIGVDIIRIVCEERSDADGDNR